MSSRIESIVRRLLSIHAARVIGSTWFGLFLLMGILVIAGVGTFVEYDKAVKVIYATPWFFALLALLALNHAVSALITLVFYTLPMYRPQYKRQSNDYESLGHTLEVGGPLLNDLIFWLKEKGYVCHNREGAIYAHRNLWGRLGGTIAHVGLVLIILGAMVQISRGVSANIPLVEGGSGERVFRERNGQMFSRNLGFSLYLRDFNVGFYPNTNQPQRFTSHLDVIDNEGNSIARGVAEVNNAFAFGGYRFHQNSYEPIPGMKRGLVKLNEQDAGKLIEFEATILPDGDVFWYPIPETNRVFALRRLSNGYHWYLADTEEMLGQGIYNPDKNDNVASEVLSGKWNVESIVLVPMYQSVLGVTTSPGMPLAYFGCFILVIGIMIGFGVPRRQVWAIWNNDNKILTIGARSRYYGARLRLELLECYNFLSNRLPDKAQHSNEVKE